MINPIMNDGATVHVLLIEDNPQHTALLQQMLGESMDGRFLLVHRESVADGLERLAQGGISLILLDLSLPDSEGLDTFHRIFSQACDTPIIVLSGIGDEALAIQTVSEGAQDYLVKGHLDKHWLVRSMQYAIERQHSQQELTDAHHELERRVIERTAELQKANTNLQREIGERKRAEEAVRESNHQLAEALGQLKATQQHIIQRERLHALGRMASGIAHDFNNALAPILGFSELLLLRAETLSDPVKVKSYVRMIHTAAKDSAKVVSRLREFYRYREEAEISAPVALGDLVAQVISLTQPKWKDQAQAKGINIKIETDLSESPTVSGNETELREMLTNVVFNAVDAISEDGAIAFHTFARDNRAFIQVSDTGMGMSEEVRGKCLEPFFSTKEQHGTGLGLGIVYGIVRRHGGDIKIASELGKGTTVTISIPMHEGEKAPPKPIVVETIPPPLRVLVVEDEPLVREVVSVYLNEDGHAVETANNGREGLEKFRNAVFDIVLTDRAMPEMNGDQLAAQIKKLKPGMPVILLTGFGDLMTDVGERPAGVDLVVSKPFTLHSLREAISKTVDKHKPPATVVS